MAEPERYDLGYSRYQVNEAIGRMLSGEIENAVSEVNQRAEEVESKIGEAERAADEAKQASQQIQDMTVEADTVPSDKNASVEKTISEEGVVNLKFSIPKGEGQDPYQDAVEHGYQGTEEQYYDSIVSLQDGPFLPFKGSDDADVALHDLTILNGLYFPNPGSTQKITARNGELKFSSGGTVDEILLDGILTPLRDTHAANKKYVDDAVASAGGISEKEADKRYLSLSGGTIVSPSSASRYTEVSYDGISIFRGSYVAELTNKLLHFRFGSKELYIGINGDRVYVSGLTNPEDNSDAATKEYVDEKFAQVAPILIEVNLHDEYDDIFDAQYVKCYPAENSSLSYSMNFTIQRTCYKVTLRTPKGYAFTGLYASSGLVMNTKSVKQPVVDGMIDSNGKSVIFYIDNGSSGTITGSFALEVA